MFDALVDDMEIDNIQQPKNNNTNQRGFSNNVNRHVENRPNISGATAGRSAGSTTNHNTQFMDGSSNMVYYSSRTPPLKKKKKLSCTPPREKKTHPFKK